MKPVFIKISIICSIGLFLTLKSFSQINVFYGNDWIIVSDNGQVDPNFEIIGNAWDCRYLTYFFINGTNDIPGNFERNAVRRAMANWSEVTNIDFIEVCAEENADIRIEWAEGAHGDGFPFDDGGLIFMGESVLNVLAHAFAPPPNGGALAGDIHFDDFEFWRLIGDPHDLESVALHELGHSLGLGHSDIQAAVMFGSYSGPRRALAQDDIDGIRSIYGPRENPVSGPVRICDVKNFSLADFDCLGEELDVTWQTSGNLTIVAGQGSGVVSIAPVSTYGIGEVTAIISSNCDELRFTYKVGIGGCDECCPSGSAYDGANCYFGVQFEGVAGFVLDNSFYTTTNCQLYPENNCCPPGSVFDGANCYFGIHFPPGYEGFVYNNGFYTTQNCETNCCPDRYQYDGKNCHSGIYFNDVEGFILDNTFYTTRNCTVYPNNNCCPPGTTYDGANCRFGPVPPGYEGFVYGNSFYTKPNCAKCCPPGSKFDGANCYFGIHFEGVEGSVLYNSFYTTTNCHLYPENDCCPPGSTFNGVNCHFGIYFPGEFEGFVFNNSFYTKPVGCYELPSIKDALLAVFRETTAHAQYFTPENQTGQNGAVVYPNPSSDYFDIDLTSIYEQVENVKLYSAGGKEILHFGRENMNTLLHVENELEAGIYFVHISLTTGSSVIKIVRL